MIKKNLTLPLRLLWLSLLLASLGITPARAQSSPIKFSTLKVDLWSEYDRATSVLVIYHVTLDPGVSLPADLALRIPAAAGEPNAVAAGQSETSLLNATYERQVSGEWSLIKFRATMPVVRLEYYDPTLIKQDASRHYEYTWPGDYSVDRMSVEVQQPYGATDLRLSPSLGSGAPGQDGLTYFIADIGSMTAGQAFTINMDYNKSSNDLSAENLVIGPADPIGGENTTGGINWMSFLPWVLAFLGVVLIAGGGFWYYQSGKSREPRQPAARRRHKASAAEREPAAAEGYVYCHHCGKRATSNDRFCRACGTRLRIE